MTKEEFFEKMGKIQEAKGYYFSNDKEKVMELIESLLINKERYGYMSCPCRLSQEDRDRDRDIICPCVYREPDVEEFGSCFCNLYVSKEWNEGKIDKQAVPERRPMEKMFDFE